MSQRSEIRARREQVSRAIADYRNFELTIEAAAEQAGMPVEEFRVIMNNMLVETQQDANQEPHPCGRRGRGRAGG